MDPIPHLGNPADQSIKEYVVSLKNFDDLNDFYNDMETPGGTLYIPDREVECFKKRPSSRNTHYLLTYDEAALIRNDPRVLTVELNPTDLGFIKGGYGFEETSTHFSKKVASDPVDLNWGFFRTLSKTNNPNWGAGATLELSGTLLSDCSGKNVDVVIMDDGCPYPTVYEYAQNPDGTGYSRMVEYNWYIHDPVVIGGAAGHYYYPSNRLQQHAGHTSGTVAGNTQGWARDANIYNITYDDSIDYVREFHKNKPINPLTGVKNPTVMNNSWGYRGNLLSPNYISKFTIRGVDYFPTSGTAGSYVWDSNIINNVARISLSGAFPARDTATDVDMIDAMSEGIIICASAGNSYWYVDVMGGPDYDNTMVYSGSTYFIHRGSSPGAADGGTKETKIICSGAMGQHNEPTGSSVYSSTAIETGDYKAEFSNYGPRIDCYAPGSGIQSIWSVGTTLYDGIAATDPRVAALNGTDSINNNFKKCPGTSMSCPQTVGVLACIAEKYPRMTQAEARDYISSMCLDSLQSTNGGAQDTKDAGFSFNPNSNKKVLLLSGTRVPTADVGGYHPVAYPELAAAARPAAGQLVPRKRTLYSYNNKATFALSVDNASVTNGGTTTVTLNTTGIANGTLVPYLITAKPTVAGTPTPIDLGISGVCTASERVPGTTSFDTRPNIGANRVTTVSALSGTCTTITHSLLGAASLTQSTPSIPGGISFAGYEDDGYWTVPLPFPISYLGNTYNSVFVGTNTYITFGYGSAIYSSISVYNPAYPKIMVSANDNSCQRIYYGVEGTAPNRTFRIRYEGTNSTSGSLGSPNMVYEITFYEATNNQFDVQVGSNARWGIQTNNNVYPFDEYSISAPLTGTVTVTNNTATLPINVSTNNSLAMTVRLGIFPTPTVTVQLN
jgi:hypothetical protein